MPAPRRRSPAATAPKIEPKKELLTKSGAHAALCDFDLVDGLTGASIDADEIKVFRTGENRLTFHMPCGDTLDLRKGREFVGALMALMEEPVTTQLP